jgi:hypothetical protein
MLVYLLALGIFYDLLVYFTAIWYLLFPFDIFCGHMDILGSPFGCVLQRRNSEKNSHRHFRGQTSHGRRWCAAAHEDSFWKCRHNKVIFVRRGGSGVCRSINYFSGNNVCCDLWLIDSPCRRTLWRWAFEKIAFFTCFIITPTDTALLLFEGWKIQIKAFPFKCCYAQKVELKDLVRGISLSTYVHTHVPHCDSPRLTYVCLNVITHYLAKKHWSQLSIALQ